MTDSTNDNINTRTSDKKHGTLHKVGAKHVESQDSLNDAAVDSSEEE